MISALLGRAADAREFFADALSLAEENDNDADRGYAWCSLARLELEQGEPDRAEAAALRALEFLADRPDHAPEAANALLVFGGALRELGRLDEAAEALTRAERLLGGYEAPGRLASVWTAQAELAVAAGEGERGVELYRRAVELLQDTHF